MGKSDLFPHFDRANQATDLILIKISGLISPVMARSGFWVSGLPKPQNWLRVFQKVFE
jgi:hypothetical protein